MYSDKGPGASFRYISDHLKASVQVDARCIVLNTYKPAGLRYMIGGRSLIYMMSHPLHLPIFLKRRITFRRHSIGKIISSFEIAWPVLKEYDRRILFSFFLLSPRFLILELYANETSKNKKTEIESREYVLACD